ncbi:MAG: phenylalanine--tRNA ligase subunit beta [Bdellovibrionaceae bacterium]|jgi:phenylalanyl-tRNA synthetase beta chain|nr:phenylalanine--tRNA ligase subunit beta [Pseudobdellovibrionaceae bacterium]
MKVSLKWINDYVDVKEFFANPDLLSEKLTSAGLEVEGLENDLEKFKNVVVGHIVEKGKHPDADKLSLCQVDVGGATQQIICGAQNHKQGDKVVVALPGAVLPGDFKIKKSKIRGVESLGMLCSEKEMGLAEDSPGIMILEASAPIGQSFAEYFGLDDVVFELSVTPNRADCLSHIGLAREIACLLGRKCNIPTPKFKSFSKLKTKDKLKLSLKESDLCPRYAGRFIAGVKIQESPAWLKQKLEAVDINSINNVVDITNFVMLELGQPLHAFDFKTIEGSEISIIKSQAGSTFKTLDGTELKLTNDELMISDGKKPVALAGVVGGENSGVSDSTTSLFVEAAYFTRETVRKTARKFGIETDSAYRFSRGVDPEGVILALNRACELIQDITGGKVAEDFYDEYPKPVKRTPIVITKKFIEEKMGYDVDAKEFVNWMTALGCKVSGDEKKWQVLAPAFRWDLFDDVDLVEEFARLHGYDKIAETMPVLESTPQEHNLQYTMERKLEDIMVEEGYMQAMNYHFVSSQFQDEFLGNTAGYASLGLNITDADARVKNPLNEDLDVMRKSCLPGLFKNLVHNYRHGLSVGRFYELGGVFRKKENDYLQSHVLSMISWGQMESLWTKNKNEYVVYDIKAAIENLMTKLAIKGWMWKTIKEDNIPSFFHPGQVSALFVEGKIIGVMGSLHPKIKDEYKIRHDVALAEFNFELLNRRQPRIKKYEAISKFPSVERDLAFLVSKDNSVQDISKEIQKVAGSLLKEVYVFDRYQSDKLPEGYESIAFRMILQHMDKTLEDTELKDLQDKILKSLEKKFKIQIR